MNTTALLASIEATLIATKRRLESKGMAAGEITEQLERLGAYMREQAAESKPPAWTPDGHRRLTRCIGCDGAGCEGCIPGGKPLSRRKVRIANYERLAKTPLERGESVPAWHPDR